MQAKRILNSFSLKKRGARTARAARWQWIDKSVPWCACVKDKMSQGRFVYVQWVKKHHLNLQKKTILKMWTAKICTRLYIKKT